MADDKLSVSGAWGDALIEMRLDAKALKAYVDNSRETEDILQRVTHAAEAEAKAKAPVDTGNLRRSITSELGRDAEGRYGRYGTNVEYGLWQEIGTRFHPAQPYLRPALNVVKELLRRV